MSDPLLALRQSIKSKSPITYTSSPSSADPCPTLSAASHILLSPSSQPLPKSTPTRLRKQGSTSTDPSLNPDDFYALDAVLLAWLLRDAATGGEYMKMARENGFAVGFVSVTERKSLVDWLEGKIEQYESIVPLVGELSGSTTPPGTPPHSRTTSSVPSALYGVGSSGDVSTSPTKRRYVADAADVEVVKKIKQNEIELRDRNTVLRGTKPNNFSAIRNVYADKLKKMKEANKPGAASASTPTTPENMYPIIMISSSPTALITMHNVKRFLQESVFEPSTTARSRSSSSRAEDLIPIYRSRSHISPSGQETTSHARYFVVDGVEALGKFGPDAWDRVVAVMTTGQAWQFRPYKWSDPRVLFHHVKGFYFKWSNDPPNNTIKDWNVTELKIDPSRRHVDKAVVAHFWKTLDAWVMSNKPWLMQG
ncbi:hypothetical protein JAAARDRAFT_126976 [Jaapia argillacea MUCL 33604]|uniref:Cell division control protein 73 C-terminal domain-containing protein n=1 Tax=Jaapia argillacea MUCL 33604 TaxID=933084 RepID=A0A067PY98_9AGAM|nr:hypothetical protein JAAARDRAFT_126976 [Jaapia argillacea MUCL 33604]